MYRPNKERYSSSSEDSSSDDDFPSPSSPRKRTYKRDDYSTLFNKLNDVQKRLYNLEMEKRKRN